MIIQIAEGVKKCQYRFGRLEESVIFENRSNLELLQVHYTKKNVHSTRFIHCYE